jgi:membrane-associated protease RseP (regulator of RpoE activity)
MKFDEMIEYSRQVIGNRMDLNYYSRLNGSVIYRQDKDKITRQEIEVLQQVFLNRDMESQLEITDREYLLRIINRYSGKMELKFGLPLFLLLSTVLTTSWTGALLLGLDPGQDLIHLIPGLPYSCSLLLILGAHEFGHYCFARRHRIHATLPYFIPFFIPYFSFGTLGAFIKMKSPTPDRRALLDVGIAGPLAGLVMSLFFILLGFWLLPDLNGVKTYVSRIHPWSDNGTDALTMGSSILFDFMRRVMGVQYLPMYEIYHFPFIFAGWIGLFVTSLNLMPIGQLDGGHVSYALFEKKARIVGILAFCALAFLNFYSLNWFVWTVLILVVMRFKHPPTMNDGIEPDTKRRLLGWFSYLIFIFCFSPMPIYFS